MNTNIGDYFQKVQKPELPPKKPQKRQTSIGLRIKKMLYRAKRWVLSHRLAASGVAALMLLTAAFPAGYGIWEGRQYNLSDGTQAILTDANKDLADKLVFDEARQAYVFNKEHMPYDIAGSNSNQDAADQVAAIRLLQKRAQTEQNLKLGGSSSEDKELHSTLLPKDFKQGVTYYDNEAKLSFTLMPKFNARAGDRVGERLVYPLRDLPGQAIYTIEDTGVKEDIVLHRFTDDRVVFSYELAMSDALESRLLENGNIGVYSADPGLFVDNTTNSQIDAEKVLSAQKTATKTKLVFEIPAPIVFDKDGISAAAQSRFELDGKNVDVVTTNLSKAQFPLSIDPTIIVANSSSLANGNNESNAVLSSSEVRRVGLTGGLVQGAWPTTTAHATARKDGGFLSYGNYAYVVGGQTGASTVTNNIQYALLNSNGTTGAWSNTTAFTTARAAQGVVAYNGFMYILGGHNGSSAVMSDVQFAQINSNGTIGTWQTTTALPVARAYGGTVAFKGFMYSYGGASNVAQTSVYSSVHYAPINANGSLGSWSTTNSLITARAGILSSLQFNGFLYAVGGYSGSANLNSVEYAPINNDGSVGTWATTTPMINATRNMATVIHGGYLYILGGYTTVDITRAYSAPVYENGTIGAWTYGNTAPANVRNGHSAFVYNNYMYVTNGRLETSGTYYRDVYYKAISANGALNFAVGTTANPAMSTSRERMAVAIYNGYLYQMGGYGGNANSYVNFTQYAKIGENGDIPTAGTTTTAITTSRADLGGLAYNGYLYNFGGYNGSTYFANVQYSAINATNGTIGTWLNGTSLPSARAGMGVVAHNNYVYSIGGRDNTGNLSEVRYATINTGGSLSSWSSTTSLPTAVNRAGVDVYNGYIYVTGGTTIALPTVNTGATSGTRSTGAAVSTVYYAKINNDGTVGTWNTTVSMNSPRSEHATVAYRGYLYAIGGFHNTTTYDTSEYAIINDNGTIGTWNVITTVSPGDGSTGRASGGAVAYNGYMYFFGGRSNSGITPEERASGVVYSEISNGGSGIVGSFTTSGSTLTTGKQYAASVYLNGYAYVLGGSNTNNYLYAPLNKNGTVGAWTSAVLPGGNVTGASAVTYNGFIYLIGGNRTTVYYGQPNANGSITNWSATTSLPASIQYANALTYNGFIYLIGGAVGSTARSTVYYSQINADKTLGLWVESSSPLPAARYSGSAVVVSGRVYYIGGFNASAQRTVHYASLNADGSVGAWTASLSQLPAARMGSVGVYLNGNIYISGGNSANTVYIASVLASGDISDWHINGTTLPANRTYASGFIANGYMYSFGGNGTTVVYHAPVNSISRNASYSKMISFGTNAHIRSLNHYASNMNGVSVTYRTSKADGIFGGAFAQDSNTSYDGSISSWGSTDFGAYYSPDDATLVAAPNGYGYMMGGLSSWGLAEGVWSFKLNADGTTSSWNEVGAMSHGVQHHTTVIIGEYLYILGGADQNNDVYSDIQYAKLLPNGGIGPWSNSVMATGLFNHVTVTANGYMYNIGGDTGTGSVNTITYAKTNADGSLGSWTTSANPLPVAVSDHSGIVVNNYLYITGGFSSDVFYAQLNADGSLGSWTTSANPLPVAVSNHSMVLANGFIYALTADGSTSVYYAQLNADGSTSPWVTSSQQSPFSTVGGAAVAANGYIYMYPAGSSFMMFSSLLRPSFNGNNISDGVYYLWVDVTITDGYMNVNYPESNLTDLKGITVAYRILAPPSARLKGGKYFENNVLQPLVRPETNN